MPKAEIREKLEALYIRVQAACNAHGAFYKTAAQHVSENYQIFKILAGSTI